MTDEKKYRIEFNREACIGAAACAAVAPNFWKIVEDGKANLLGGKKLEENKKQVREITEKEFKKNLEAAENCPVNVIHIFEKKTGRKLI